MTLEVNSQLFAMHTMFDSLGEVSKITFYNHNTGFGPLETADMFARPIVPTSLPVDWVKAEDLAARLQSMITSFERLTTLADFSEVKVDEDGAPYVLEVVFSCEACARNWHEEFSDYPDYGVCPRCRNNVRAWPGSATWIGPNVQMIYELWQHLSVVRRARKTLEN